MPASIIYKGLRVHVEGREGFLNQDVHCNIEGWFTDAEENWFFDAISGVTDGLEEPEVPLHFHDFYEKELLPFITWIPKEPEYPYTTTYPAIEKK